MKKTKLANSERLARCMSSAASEFCTGGKCPYHGDSEWKMCRLQKSGEEFPSYCVIARFIEFVRSRGSENG